MPDCIFCKIINKEIPAFPVYEDENFLAIIDIHPLSPGHCQIISKKHYRWVWDLPDSSEQSDEGRGGPTIGKYFEVARKIAKAQMKAFNTDWILSKIDGQDVHHAHIWVYPNNKIDGDPQDFEGNKNKIIENLI